MSFERSFKVSSFLLIAAGFLALVSTGGIAPLPAALMAAVIVAAWFVDTERVNRLIPRRVLNTFAVACLPLYLADYKWVSRSFLVATIHLVFVFAAIKLVTRAADRDYVYLYLISSAQLLTASTMTIFSLEAELRPRPAPVVQALSAQLLVHPGNPLSREGPNEGPNPKGSWTLWTLRPKLLTA